MAGRGPQFLWGKKALVTKFNSVTYEWYGLMSKDLSPSEKLGKGFMTQFCERKNEN